MKLLKLWRTFKEGFKNFYRNGWLSVATAVILTLSLYIVGIFAIVGVASNVLLKNIQGVANISVYFNPEVSEAKIMEIKSNLESFREINSVKYVSKKQAMQELLSMEDIQDAISRAVEEVGNDALPASLIITAKQSDQYEIISQAIRGSYGGEIEKIEDNKKIIDEINGITKLSERAGLVLGIIFLLIAMLITFNTIRITMYSHRQEFEIMRLVGASNLYVRMPFVFEGIFYGLFTAITATLFLFATVKFIFPVLVRESASQSAKVFFEQVNSFYFQYIWLVFGILLLFGLIVGVISGFIAIRRYLKV